MRLSIADWYPAHHSNYTASRNRPVRFITIHHTAANNSTLRHLWANPARNGSSHFFVHGSRIEQYVDLRHTAWTNGNFASNNECITIEVNGDWRGGFRNQAALNNLERLMREIIKHYPNIGINYHNDISSTQCPGELKSKGLAKAIYDKIKKENTVSKVVTEKDVKDYFKVWLKKEPSKSQLAYYPKHHWRTLADDILSDYRKSRDADLAKANKQVSDLTKRLTALEKTNKEQAEALAKANKQFDAIAQKLDDKIEELNDQIDINVAQKEEMNLLHQDIKDLRGEVSDLEKENTKLQKRNADLELELGTNGELTAWQHFQLFVKKLFNL